MAVSIYPIHFNKLVIINTMRPLYLLVLAAPLFLNLHCKKDAEPEITKDPDLCELYGVDDARCRAQELAKLPAYTQVGAGTFGCLLNGKAFIPSTCCGDFFNPPLPKWRSDYYINDKTYYLEAKNKLDQYSPYYNIGLNLLVNLKSPRPIKLIIQKGEYLEKSGGGISLRSNSSTISYNTFDPSSGQIIISKLDTNNQTISGTFEFKAANETDTITITDGRFDLPYSLQ
jgi:hypothetical protein